MTQIEQLYITAQALRKDAEAVEEALAMHNPGIINGKPSSLATIAADLGTLAYHYNNLRVDVIQTHEKIQRNEK